MNMAKSRKEVNEDYNSKNKVIGVRLNKDQLKMLNIKYPGINGPMVRGFLLNNEYTLVVKNKVTYDQSIKNQIMKIGNNINQIAFLSNAKKDVVFADKLKSELEEIKILLNKLYDHKIH